MNNIDDLRVAVLASIMHASEFSTIDINLVMASGITKEWFEDESQKKMFEVMRVLYDGGKSFDNRIIMEYMLKSGVTNPHDLVLHVSAQNQLPQSVVLEYMESLREAYSKRLLLELREKITVMFADENTPAAAVAQVVQNTLDLQQSCNGAAATRRLSEVRKERLAKPPVQRLRTHIPFIDTVLTDKAGNKGIRNEGLFFISGLKQSGKTFVLTRLIENISKEHPVMFGSMEFGEELYDENIVEQENDGHFEGNIDNIFTFDSIYETNAIVAEIKLQHKLHNIKLVALDSMMRMTNNNPDLKTDERRISEMFSKLGKVSKELKIPIVIVVQSSKEDLKSSMISVKGSMNADHEAYVWFHLTKTKPKNPDDEMRTVIWNKNKDTHKHPQQHLMFVPQTRDFYRVEIDEHGNAAAPLDKFRRPPAKAIETVYESIPKSKSDLLSDTFEMPQF